MSNPEKNEAANNAALEVIRPVIAAQSNLALGGGITDDQLTVADVMRQVGAIKELQAKAMVSGVHYGTIPGTNKPTLLLPGAQMLGLTFRFRATFEEKQTDLVVDGFAHREFFVKCTINNARGDFMGLGMGSCSTMESKYRFRKRENVEVTEHPIPDSFFRLKDQKQKARLLAQIMDDVSSIYVPHKVAKGVWRIARVIGGDDKVPYSNPADYYNTVLKIAKKRAFVDAILTVTAASDTFTQDVEDLQDNAEVLTETTGEAFIDPPGDEGGTGTGTIETAEQAAAAAKALKEKKDKEKAGGKQGDGAKKEKQQPPKTWGENVVHLGTLAGRSVGSLTVAELQKIKTTWIDDAKRWTKATPQDKLLRIHVIQALGHYAENPQDAPNAAPAETTTKPAQEAAPTNVGEGEGWDVVQAAARIEDAIKGEGITEADWFARLRSLNQIPDGKEWKTLDDVDDSEWIKTQEAGFASLTKLWKARQPQPEATAATPSNPALTPDPDDIPLDPEETEKPTKLKRGSRKPKDQAK